VLAVSLGVAAVGAQDAAARRATPSFVTPSTPIKPTGSDGFLQRWLILGPMKVPGDLTEPAVQKLVKSDAVAQQFSVVPRDGDKPSVGESGPEATWHAIDTLAYNVNLFHFASSFKQPTSNVLFSIVTIVHAPRDLSDVRLAIGSNAASVWWVNGQEVIGIYNDRQSVIDDGVSKRLTLKKGPNVIRAVVVNGGGATDFCARFLDEEGRPVKGLTVNLSER
jgi:hypothetical protein